MTRKSIVCIIFTRNQPLPENGNTNQELSIEERSCTVRDDL